MDKTDRQTDKSTRWQFTAYQDQWDLFKEIPDIVAEWMWQTETCPNTGKLHYQGCIRTKSQQRHKAMRCILPGVHIEVARNWEALVLYCKKEDTRVEGSFVKEVNTRRYLKFHDALIRVANAYVDEYANVANAMATLDFDNAILLADVDRDKTDTVCFHKAVEQLCSIYPEDISLYSNPQLIRAWKMCRGLWLRMSACANDVCSHACECSRVHADREDYSRQVEQSLIAETFFSSYGIELDAT